MDDKYYHVPEQYKYICDHCYHIGEPEYEHFGSWPAYFARAIPTFLIIIIPTIIYLIGIFFFFLVSSVFNRGLPDSHALIELFPLWQYMPHMPYTIKSCKYCKKPNHMFPIKSREGQHALYWREKEHINDGVDVTSYDV